MGGIATRWRDLSGENEWKGLLDPLHIDLRRYIIHCGERAAAVGDALISEEKSENCGRPRYARKNLFSSVGLEIGNPYKYVVKKYIYGAPLLGKSTWLGYVAVATDEGKQVLGRRDILISWRGTRTKEEWVLGSVSFHASASDIAGEKHNPKVQFGWHTYYTNADPESPYNQTSARNQVLAAVRELVDQYKDEEISITVTGHSMGASMAVITATDIAYNGYNKPTGGEPDKACLVTAIVFASPRVGDQGFKKAISSINNLHILRVVNKGDVVAGYPPFGYEHVGKKLKIYASKSPYLKRLKRLDPRIMHDLQVTLHGVAGTQGKHQAFKLEVNRDYALVNKWVDAVEDKYNVVAKWWKENNKSMVQTADGCWVLKADYYEKEDAAATAYEDDEPIPSLA